jgi:hypothetical protein
MIFVTDFLVPIEGVSMLNPYRGTTAAMVP